MDSNEVVSMPTSDPEDCDSPEPELPPCEVERLPDILLTIQSTRADHRCRLAEKLYSDNGSYIEKLLNLFDVCELENDKYIMDQFFHIFFALVELGSKDILLVLVNDTNFFSVLGVLGHNPSLLHEMDFRSTLEQTDGYKELIPIRENQIRHLVHANFRLHVLKDNVLARTLPENAAVLIDHILNEHNHRILTYISESDEYLDELKRLLADENQRKEALGLVKELVQLVRSTKSNDSMFRSNNLNGVQIPYRALHEDFFVDQKLFDALANALASDQGQERSTALDILLTLLYSHGPDRLRAHVVLHEKTEIPMPRDDEYLVSKKDQSLLRGLISSLMQSEDRGQVVSILKELFRVPLGQDDQFLGLLYPNYMAWLLQPLKSRPSVSTKDLFSLQASILDLFAFCTEHHGYRIKYLLGRQPIGTYMTPFLESKNKFLAMEAIKWVRVCVLRRENFFSKFLTQQNLLAPLVHRLAAHGRKDTAMTSAVLDVLATIERENLVSLVEYLFKHYYDTYQSTCPLVFEAIRVRYQDRIGQEDGESTPVMHGMDAEEERYFDKDIKEDTPKLVDYEEEEDDGKELELPVRPKEEEEEDVFHGGLPRIRDTPVANGKKASPKGMQNMFAHVSWTLQPSNEEQKEKGEKRKLDLGDDEQGASPVKRGKPCTRVRSS